MKRFLVLVLSVTLVFMFAACAKKETVKSEEPVTQEAQKAAPVEVKKEEAPAVTKEAEKKVETVAVKEVEAKTDGSFDNIHFDFDKYNIRDDAKPTLKTVSDWLLKSTKSKMLVEGHCDDRGTNEYNLALGERRAKSTRDYLVSLGIKKDRLDIISFGEEKPLCKEQTEECWQKNRRAQFIVKEGKAK